MPLKQPTNRPERKTETPLQKYLFYKGQVYFQILCAAALIIGTVVLKWLFSFYGLPDYFFKIILLVGFSLTLIVIGLQAYLHHYVISRGISPVSWLAQELKQTLFQWNEKTSSEPANIPDLEKGIKEILKTLGYYRAQYSEVKSLMETLEGLIDLLGRYWQAATRNEILSAMGRVSAEMAHDLKGPLSSIQVALTQLRTNPKDERQLQSCLNLLELGANRLNGVTNNLLSKYRGETEEKIIFSIHHILDELTGEFQYHDQYSAVKFIKQYHPTDLYIEADRHALQRLFGNLIKNGAEAMQFVGKITLRTKPMENKMIVEIADTGCGIPQAKLDKIFGDYSGKKDGHGIGLQFVKKTALAHEGRVWVESVFGEGSSFFVELPLVLKEMVSSFILDVPASKPVVIIDDDPSILEQWRLVLEKLNVNVQTHLSYEAFCNSEQQSSSPMVAIIDYHFNNSELNGLQIIAKLKEQGFKNLYLCTAEYWKPLLKKQAVELGVRVIPKPLPEIKIVLRSTFDVLCSGEGKKGYKVLVIDDDASIRLSWEVMALKLHIETLHTFPNLEALLQAPIDLKQIDIAFVDKNIRDSQHSGGAVVDYLKAQGVAKVVLASGENEEELRADPAFAQADFILGEKIPRSFKEFFS